ncbi:MAG: cytochrome c oxidase assembly protein [Gammaproteobacteria bacterium]|nr:cytochrome c oxidase assembly protein [Gammaproteobacteria bacterium]
MDPSILARKNRRTVRKLALVGVAMFGFGFLLVPLYDVFCDITGLNGKTGRLEAAEAGVGIDEQRKVTVEFIANVRDGMGWDFKPQVTSMEVHPGALMTTSFVAVNNQPHGVTGHAVPSVAPGRASRYFNKTECFCFSEQYLASGESKDMPVKFIVDTDLPRDVKRLTLSYTFFSSGDEPG